MNDQSLSAAPLQTALIATSEAVERILTPMLAIPTGPEARVVECMRYSLFSGGKRLRPFLVLAASELFGVGKAQALRTAAAIECVHCYSLMHDDLPAMDDDDIRRGKPTAHIKFDEATAVLAGDALQALAFQILSESDTHADPSVRVELVSLLAKASGHSGMVGGQMIDLTADGHNLCEAEVYRLQQLKTGALISFSVEAGAILGRASPKVRQSLQYYAHDLGLAFQIADDLLDVLGDADVVGKATGKDEDAGKATLVGLMGVEKAARQAQILADQAIEHLADFDERAALLRAVAHFAVNRQN